MTGMVFDIQRFSIHDGPGIRTTVFLKGCPLACAWCHNPEGIARGQQLFFMPDKCIGCGYCFRVCEKKAHRMEGDRHVLDRGACVVCGRCAVECYAGAIELVGKPMTVEQVMAEVLSDKPFYETSGGGMTLSGGEPLYQVEFTHALLQAAKSHGLHCCMETSGLAAWDKIEQVRGLVDLFLFDVKDTQGPRHRANTGVSNQPTLANLRALHAAGAKIVLRVPLIYGYNDQADNLEGTAALALELPNLLGVELMGYHKLGLGKHERLGTQSPLASRPPADDPARLQAWIQELRARGVKVLNEM